MFLVLLAQFSQIISGEQHFLSSFTPTRISKFHASWWLTCTQTQNFIDFLHTLYMSCFFRSWRDTDPGNNFLWGQVISMFTPASHWEMFISARCQTTCQTDIKNNIFRTNIIQKDFNLLQTEQVDSQLRPSLSSLHEHFLTLPCSLTQSTCGKSNQSVNLQTHAGLEGILSNYFSVSEEGFPVWTTLLLFALSTLCQSPSVNFDMSNLRLTVTHI